MTISGTGLTGFHSRVLASPAGEGGECPFTIPASAARLELARNAWWEAYLADTDVESTLSPQVVADVEQAAADFGAELFASLFAAQTGELYQRSLGRVEHDGGLRLRLRFAPGTPGFGELDALRWELLRQPDAGARRDSRPPLALNARTPVVRHIEADRSSPPSWSGGLRVLALASNPLPGEALALEREMAALEDACLDLGVEFSCLKDPRLDQVRAELSRFSPHVLHFTGHTRRDARGVPVLVLADAKHRGRDVTPDELVVKLSGTSLQLVCLNACNTAGDGGARAPAMGLATALALTGVPAIVAMQDFISDDGALVFSRAFYDQLARHATIDEAVIEGRQALYGASPIEWSTPVLFSRGPTGAVVARESARRARVTSSGGGAGRALALYLGHLAQVLEGQLILPWLPTAWRPSPDAPGVLMSLRAQPLSGDARGPRERSVDVARLIGREARLLLLGDAGSGKTMTLRRSAWQDARAAGGGGAAGPCLERRTPFLVSGGEWAIAWLADRRLQVETLLTRAFASASGADEVDGRAAVQRILERGAFCVYVDDLDGAGGGEARTALAQALEDFSRRWIEARWRDAPPVRSEPEPTRPWRQLVAAARANAQALAPTSWTRCKLIPLSPDDVRAFCRAWQAASPPGPPLAETRGASRREDDLLRSLERFAAGQPRVMGNPLMLSLFCLAHAEAQPPRRVTILESVAAAWIARDSQSGEARAGAARAVLEALAQAMCERGEHELGDVSARAVVGGAAPGVIAAVGGLGPVRRGEGGAWTFAHRCLQEYLAACALVREREGLVARLVERLDEPAWADVLPLALARLGASLEEEDLARTLLAFLEQAADSAPQAELLLADAAAEMARLPRPVTQRAVERLLAAHAQSGDDVARMIEGALHELTEADGDGVERAVASVLRAGVPHEIASAARIVERLRLFTPRVADALRASLEHPAAGGDVDRALRALVRADAELLGDEPGALRRVIVRRPELARRARASGAWRRLLLAVYGGVPDVEPGPGSALHRESRGLTPAILRALDADRAAQTLRHDLDAILRGSDDAQARADAWLARLAIDGCEPEPVLGAQVPGPARLAGVEQGLPQALSSALPDALAALALHAREARISEDRGPVLLHALLDAAGRRVSCAAALTGLYDAFPGHLRPLVLAELWQAVLEGSGDPAYNLAVLLDTHGAALARSPEALARTLAQLPHTALGAGPESPAPASQAAGPHVAQALDVLASWPRSLDFARAWVLGLLAPLCAGAWLDEAVALALTLSGRMGARRDALARLLPGWHAGRDASAPVLDDLLRRLHAEPEPLHRFRTGLRLAAGVDFLRAPAIGVADEADRRDARGPWREWFRGLLGHGSRGEAWLPAAARAIEGAHERAWAFEQLARLARGAARRDALESARRAATAIPLADARARSRARLALASEGVAALRLWRAALADAREVRESARRAALVEDLGRHLPDSAPLRTRWRRLVADLPAPERARARGLRGQVLLEGEPLLGGAGAAPLVLAALLDDARAMHGLGSAPRRRASSTALTRDEAQGLVRSWEQGQSQAPPAGPADSPWPREAASVLEAAQVHHAPHVRRQASLWLAASADVTSRSLPHLVDLLASRDDGTRQCARAVMASGRGSLSALALGRRALESVAEAWLAAQETDPARALALLWFLERIEHDDVGLLRSWAIGERGSERPVRTILLRNVNAVAPRIWPEVLGQIPRTAPEIQRALLQSSATLAARGRLEGNTWATVAQALSRISPEAVEDETFVLDGAQLVASAVLRATWVGPLGEGVALALRAHGAGRRRLEDLLRLPAAELRSALTALGRVRIVGPHRARAARAAAQRLEAHPAAVVKLLAWIEHQLGDAAQPDDYYGLLVPDLLAVAVAVGERQPGAVRESAVGRPLLTRRLAETAGTARFHPARADALRLLSQAGRVTCEVVTALHVAMRDAGPVQAAALASLPAYREADEDALERLVAALQDASPAVSYVSARLVAALQRAARPSASRRRLARELHAALRSPDARRRVWLWQRVPPDPRRGRWVSRAAGTLAERLQADVLGRGRGPALAGQET